MQSQRDTIRAYNTAFVYYPSLPFSIMGLPGTVSEINGDTTNVFFFIFHAPAKGRPLVTLYCRVGSKKSSLQCHIEGIV